MRLIACYALLSLALTLFMPQDAEDEHAAARPLFLLHCAACHGEKGDGQGTTDLDRAARSFMDGGFSFGNTPEALFRTLTTGIPGTPMPGFDGALTEDQRRAVAAYVVTLGPPITPVDEEKTVMHVTDRPRVVRGMLPPITRGAEVHTRGLLIGLQSGQTFEYRVDDVRLLGVRQGGFVKRQDWTGRGGTGLAPLGKVVHVVDGGKPTPTFADANGENLRARLGGTWIEGDSAGLRYRLVDADGKPVAWVRESVRSVGRSTGSGFARRFVLRGIGEQHQLVLRVPDGDFHDRAKRPPSTRYRVELRIGSSGLENNEVWTSAKRDDGLFDVRGWCGEKPFEWTDKPNGWSLEISRDTDLVIEVIELVTLEEQK